MSETNDQRYWRLAWENDPRVRRWTWNLAHNLTIGAGLCRAWRTGYTTGGSNPQERVWWKPGCGKAAP